MLSDEFSYLLRNEPAIGSVFQKVWDHSLTRIPLTATIAVIQDLK